MRLSVALLNNLSWSSPVLSHDHFEGRKYKSFSQLQYFCPQEAASVSSRSGWESLVRSLERHRWPFCWVFRRGVHWSHCSNQALGDFFKEEKNAGSWVHFVNREERTIYMYLSHSIQFWQNITTKSSGFENMSIYRCWFSLSFQIQYVSIHIYI